MAEGGYQCDFVSEVPEDLACVVCLHALKNPVQMADCGHRLCKTCFNQLKDDAETRYYAVTEVYSILLQIWVQLMVGMGLKFKKYNAWKDFVLKFILGGRILKEECCVKYIKNRRLLSKKYHFLEDTIQTKQLLYIFHLPAIISIWCICRYK